MDMANRSPLRELQLVDLTSVDVEQGTTCKISAWFVDQGFPNRRLAVSQTQHGVGVGEIFQHVLRFGTMLMEPAYDM
jgi:hypothetical protein